MSLLNIIQSYICPELPLDVFLFQKIHVYIFAAIILLTISVSLISMAFLWKRTCEQSIEIVVKDENTLRLENEIANLNVRLEALTGVNENLVTDLSNIKKREISLETENENLRISLKNMKDHEISLINVNKSLRESLKKLAEKLAAKESTSKMPEKVKCDSAVTSNLTSPNFKFIDVQDDEDWDELDEPEGPPPNVLSLNENIHKQLVDRAVKNRSLFELDKFQIPAKIESSRLFHLMHKVGTPIQFLLKQLSEIKVPTDAPLPFKELEFTLITLMVIMERKEDNLAEAEHAYIFTLIGKEEEHGSADEVTVISSRNMMRLHYLKVFLAEQYLALILGKKLPLARPLEFKERVEMLELKYVKEMVFLINETYFNCASGSENRGISSAPAFYPVKCFQIQ